MEAGFTNDGVAELLGAEAVAALDREQVVPGQLRILDVLAAADRATATAPLGSPAPPPQMPRHIASARSNTGLKADTTWQIPSSKRCAVLTALWLVSLEVTVEQANIALPRIGVDGLQRLRLVEVRAGAGRGPDVVVPYADLRPYQIESASGQRNLWVTSDLSAHQVSGALPHDHVLGIGQASLTLAATTHRRPAATALDIGTGCGLQLLHLLSHCEHVTGTDLSQRALDFARFNLLINADALDLDPHRLSDRVELLRGSLLEPVTGRSFSTWWSEIRRSSSPRALCRSRRPSATPTATAAGRRRRGSDHAPCADVSVADCSHWDSSRVSSGRESVSAGRRPGAGTHSAVAAMAANDSSIACEPRTCEAAANFP